MKEHLKDQNRLKDHIRTRLLEQAAGDRFDTGGQNDKATAAVLFFLGMHRPGPDKAAEPCLIFNQRSRHVRQPGDLCFPGGGLSPRLDSFLARLLTLPGLPLFHWARFSRRPLFPEMPRLLATSIRESFEEMRLNPLRIRFLGPMAPEHFKHYGRTIYPMVAWNHGQETFSPNWEVDRIVYIPLRRFFLPGAYARLPAFRRPGHTAKTSGEFPCLVYESGEQREILWGLTYRIVMRFLKIVFNFTPPKTSSLPMLH
jgi:8-oxo-dGTP pyrophosphatase MutT (NUDIX family)